MSLKNLILVTGLMFSLNAWSLVEVNMTYTGLLNSPEKTKVYTGSGTVPKTTGSSGIGADLIFTLPFGGFGIGARYENLGFSYSGNGIKFDGAMTRTAAILNWRWIDTLVYFGPILTYGVSHSDGKIKVVENGTTISDLTADSQTSYSAGLELGAKLLSFRVGAEAGYMSYEWKKLTGTSGSITSVGKLDMGGSYAKIVIGFGI